MSLWTRIKYLFFGEGSPVPERAPVPLTRSERHLAYAAAVFLIAVAVYIPTRIFENRAYYEGRHHAVFEECVLSTQDFKWCWINLGY